MTESLSSSCVEVYLHFRQLMSGETPRRRSTKKAVVGDSVAFEPGRDANALGNILEGLASELGWKGVLAESAVITDWPQIVGQKTADFSTPVSFTNGVLEVSCQSTAWATQLRLMRVEIIAKIQDKYPEAKLVSVQFKGPNAPSWKKGSKSVSGRGPRDTYG